MLHHRHRVGSARVFGAPGDEEGVAVLEVQEIPDDDLVVRLRAGDDDAFRQLYERHRRDVEAYARRICPVPSLVDDIVAEAFCKTLRAIRNGHGPTDGFRLYVFTAARRTSERMTTLARHELSGLVAEVACSELEVDGAEAELLAAAPGPAVEALRRMPDRARRALWLVDVEGWSTAELGRAMGLSTNAASALAYRSRLRLREIYLSLVASNSSASWYPSVAGSSSEGA